MLTPVAKSAVAEIRWPALPDATAATLLALAFQLERTQWWPQERLREQQFAQLDALVAHAFRTVPFHRERLAAAGYREGEVLTADLWAELPLLTRREVQEAGDALHSPDVPASHGRTVSSATSGSTGMPVRILLTETVQLFWHAFVLRDRLWHRLDGDRTFCAPSQTFPALSRLDPAWTRTGF